MQRTSELHLEERSSTRSSDMELREEVSQRSRFGFFLVLLYLVIEYGRPMDTLGFLKVIRPAMIVMILMVLSWLRLRNLKLFTNSKQTVWMWALIGLMALSVPFARNNYWAYRQTLGMVQYMPFFLSVIFYVDSFARLRRFLDIWILLLIYLSLKGISGHGIAGSNFLQDENDFSLLINMMLPFSVFLFMCERRPAKKILYVVASILAIVSVVASSSRGGFVGLVAVLAVIWLFSPRKIVSLVVMGLLVTAVYFAADQKYWDEMATVTNKEDATRKVRFDSWTAGWEMFKAHPLGVGAGNFPVRFPEYQPEDMERGMWGRAAHSLWFTLLPELGIFGILIYFSLLRYNLRDIFWLRRFKREDNDDLRYACYLSLAFVGSFAGYFSSGTFLSVLYYPHYFYLTALIVATRRVAEQKRGLLSESRARA